MYRYINQNIKCVNIILNNTSISNSDIDVGGLLTLIKSNVRRNSVNGNIVVLELDFKKEWSPEVRNRIRDVEIIFAADGKL